jgi:hypothetical protein
MERNVGRRVVIGREVRVIHETPDEVHLEGAMRLSPGLRVELVFAAGEARSPQHRNAVVTSWSVSELGNGGPRYRGICQWLV